MPFSGVLEVNLEFVTFSPQLPKQSKPMKLLLSNNTPLSLLPTSISTSKSQSFLKQSWKDNQEPEANGLFLIACIEAQLDFNFKVVSNLQST